MTAPATVSGEQPRVTPLSPRLGKVRESIDPRVRRPAITSDFVSLAFELKTGGAPGQEQYVQDVQARATRAFSQQPVNGRQGFACFTETSVLLLLVASGVISALMMTTIFLVL